MASILKVIKEFSFSRLINLIIYYATDIGYKTIFSKLLILFQYIVDFNPIIGGDGTMS